MNTDSKLKIAPIAVAVALSTSMAGSAVAQGDGGFSLEEIIVTARKVEESLQDVPLSITALTAEDIAERNIEELEDVALFTPGLTFEDYSNGGFSTPIIRGASQFSVDQLEQNVSTFIDGVYIPRNYALDLGSMNMERIEVVKGPQSALHGANAFMGAINYVTKGPNLDELEGTVSAVVGDGGRTDISGGLSVPLSPGVVAMHLSASTTQYDGDWDNDHPAANDGPSQGTDDSLGGWDKDAFSVSILAQPTDATRLEFAYHEFDSFTEGRAQTRLEVGELNCGGNIFGGPPRGYCGELPDTPLEPGTTTPTGFFRDPREFGMMSDTSILRAEFAVDVTENVSLTYQFANIEGDVFSAGNSDRDPIAGQDDRTGTDTFGNAFTMLPIGGFDYDSHELRVEFQADTGLYAMIGAFYSDGEDLDDGAGGYFAPLWTESLDPITPEAFQAAVTTNDFLTVTETTAIFGRVSYPLMEDKLVLAFEGRYTDEEKDIDITYNDLTEADPYTDSYFTPRISADYSLNDNQLIYLSAAKGVKSGGYNNEISGGLELEEREYGPDENTTFELGSKNTLLDGRLQWNGTLFYTEWEDLQVTQAAINGGFFTTSITGNLGSATLQGLETDLTYAVTDGLTLIAGLALIDATYDSGTISQRLDRANICDDIVCAADGSIGGNDLPRSSDTQWNIGAQYDGTLSNGFDYFIRADAVGQSDQFVSEANIATIPSRSLINLRAGISDENWSAELWVKNAGDEEYVSNAFYIPNPFFIALVPSWGNLRRAGLTLEYNF